MAEHVFGGRKRGSRGRKNAGKNPGAGGWGGEGDGARECELIGDG